MRFIIIHLFFFIINGFSFTNAYFPPYIKEQPPYEQAFYLSKMDGQKVLFSLPCKVDGSSPLSYIWTKNGTQLTLPAIDGRYALGSDKSSLVFFKLLETDAGIYQCIVKNNLGTAISRQITVRKGIIDSDTEEVLIIKEVEEGSSLMLPCNAPSGSPKPYFQWFVQNSTGFQQSVNHPNLVVDPKKNLWLTYIDTKMNNWTFRCESYFSGIKHYGLGSIFLLYVKSVDKSREKVDIKTLYVTNSTVNAVVGDNVKIFCIFGEVPNIDMIIFTRDKYGSLKQTENMILRNNDRSLYIKNISMEDSGKYFCEVSGKGILGTIDVVVSENPQIPKITFENRIKEAFIGETVQIEAKIKGDPIPDTHWTFNGQPLIGNNSYQKFIIFKNVLIMDNVTEEYTGNYGFKAVNIHGFDYSDISLRILPRLPPKI